MKQQRAERLRTTIDFLPPDTKRAMLAGLEENRIITGANTDRRGGMCPMIAADRNAFESGPMADIFAAVWDSYNGACILNRRDASERDLRTLKTMLETSLANSPELSSQLGQAWLDYHVGAEAGTPGAGNDFGQELTSALEQSALLDTGSFAPLSTSPAPAAPAAPAPRKIELVYDGGPIPRTPAPAAGPRALADQQTARTQAPVTAGPPAPGRVMNSTYEPYTVASPRRRTPVTRASVDAPRSRPSRHAADTTASAERANARAVIANQAATLRGRAWPRSAAPQSALAPAPAPVPAVRHELPATPFEAPAIRQAAIPQSRSQQAGAGAPGTRHANRPGTGADDRTAELQGRTGWSWLPPYRSYDDHEDTLATTGQVEPGPRAVPEAQPPDDQRRPVRS
jgi:hypothetical protein